VTFQIGALTVTAQSSSGGDGELTGVVEVGALRPREVLSPFRARLLARAIMEAAAAADLATDIDRRETEHRCGRLP